MPERLHVGLSAEVLAADQLGVVVADVPVEGLLADPRSRGFEGVDAPGGVERHEVGSWSGRGHDQ